MMNEGRKLSGFVCVVVLLCCWPAAARDLFVAPVGTDSGVGTIEQPFGSIARAQQAVRQIRASQPDRDEPIVVSIRGGRYHLTEPMIFRPDDSGSAAAPVVYRAYRDERPIFSGGRRIAGWQSQGDGVWKVTLPEVKAGDWTFSQLFVDDQRRFRPRLPKSGYHQVAESLDPSRSDSPGHDRFQYSGDDVHPDWARRDDVELLMFHVWSASRMRIKTVDEESQIVEFKMPTRSRSRWSAFSKGHRWLAINVREALSEPGQWYLDRASGELTYLAKPGESSEVTEVIAPFQQQLLEFRGDVEQQQWVEHIQLKGLTFAHTNRTLGPDGYTMPQAEIGMGEAITAFGARHLLFERCCVRHVGGWALGFGPGCRYNTAKTCEMWDLGAGGVKIGYAGAGDWSGPISVPKTPEAIV
jgi:hypothetical protein